VVRFLIAKGAVFDPNRLAGQSPLHEAAARGHRNVVGLLLAKGVPVDARSNEGTPLHEAAEWARPAMVKFLLNKKASVRARDGEGKTPLARAARGLVPFFQLRKPAEKKQATRRVLETLRLLLAARPDLRARDNRGQTALHIAASQYPGDDPEESRCHLVILKLLLKAGLPINAGDNQGYTPLHHAVEGGYADRVALLLAKGARVNARDQFGRTPLWHASRLYGRAIEKLLRKHGGKE
jgi:ankyrin repeat protein